MSDADQQKQYREETEIAEVRIYLTERVKSPGLLLLGRAKKLPWTPRVNRSCSASIPVMLGWNHLKDKSRLFNTQIHHVLEEWLLCPVAQQLPFLWRQNRPQRNGSKQYIIYLI